MGDLTVMFPVIITGFNYESLSYYRSIKNNGPGPLNLKSLNGDSSLSKGESAQLMYINGVWIVLSEDEADMMQVMLS